MPFRHTVSEDGTFVTITASGSIDMQAFEALARLLGEVRLAWGAHVLADCRHASSAMSARAMSDAALGFRALPLKGVQRIAFVVDRDHLFGLARAFSCYAEQHGLACDVFRTAEAARRWLTNEVRLEDGAV